MLAALLLNLEPNKHASAGTGKMPTWAVDKARDAIEAIMARSDVPEPIREAVLEVPSVLDRATQESDDLAELSELTRLLQMRKLELSQALKQVDENLQVFQYTQTILFEITILLEKFADDEEAILAILLSE